MQPDQINERVYDADVARRLAVSGLHPVLARVFAARGIEDAEQLETDVAGLLHYGLLKNIHVMAQRLADAISARQQVTVIADYDADGATACAVAVRGLALLGLPARFWVPNRFVHGYGLSPEIVRLVAAGDDKPDIILTVDNGISSCDGVELANEMGIAVLITDHHLPGEALPAALIVNPNQPGCAFPDKHLAGVGVMFYVLLATRAELRARGMLRGDAPNLAQLLDLVALGTVADVVRLDRNNRILVEQGLRRIRQGRACAGVRALFAVAGRAHEQASAADLGFLVAPRLNAAGRLEDMSLGIACLLCDADSQAMLMAERLNELNAERRDIEAAMQQQALACLPDLEHVPDYSLALFDPGWHVGVIGIVAARLKERFHRPVICFARGSDGEIKGSGRSIAGLHLRDALDRVAKRAPGLVRKFGGHAMAAGLSIDEARFAEFSALFEQAVQSCLTPEDLRTRIVTDGQLAEADFSPPLAQAIRTQVWGQGFPTPSFTGVFRVLAQRVLKERHLKLKLGYGECRLDSILFQRNEPLPDVIRAVYQLEWHLYRGQGDVQVRIMDWCAAVA